MSLDEPVAEQALPCGAGPGGGWRQIATADVAAIAYGATVSLNGRLWGLDGDPNRTMVYSADGVTWRAESGLPYRAGAAACAHNGSLYVSGGALSAETNDVFISRDGVGWTRTQAPWPPRYGHCMISFQGRLLVFGGRTQRGQVLQDLWWSHDGLTWHVGAGAPGRVNGGAAVISERLCALGGPDRGVAWYDGQRWVTETPPWSARLFPGLAVVGSSLVLVGGLSGDGRLNDTWSWTEGRGWRREADAPWSDLEAPSCGELGGQVVVFGGSRGGGPASPAVYAFSPG